MPRRARLSIPGIPWHIIQRGNNRLVCFFAEEDYDLSTGVEFFFVFLLAMLSGNLNEFAV